METTSTKSGSFASSFDSDLLIQSPSQISNTIQKQYDQTECCDKLSLKRKRPEEDSHQREREINLKRRKYGYDVLEGLKFLSSQFLNIQKNYKNDSFNKSSRFADDYSNKIACLDTEETILNYESRESRTPSETLSNESSKRWQWQSDWHFDITPGSLVVSPCENVMSMGSQAYSMKTCF